MAFNKIESIKEASFYKILRYSMVFSIFIFLIVSTFGTFLYYLMMKSSEEDLSNVLIKNIEQKENRLYNISESLALTMEENTKDEDKKRLLDFKIKDEEDILGILILDEKGKVINSSSKFNALVGYDFSEQSYYKKSINKNKTIISDPFISQFDKKISMSFATPFRNSENKKCILVLLISPDFIENSQKDLSLKYMIASSNGDIIFSNGNYDKQLLDTKVFQNMKKGDFDTFIHKDEDTNKYMLTTIKADSRSSTYVVVQHYLFNNKNLVNGLILIAIFNILLVVFFILLFSSKFSEIVNNYINILLKEVTKIQKGNYDLVSPAIYPYKELNEFMASFYDMAHKVNQREQELLVYNEELKASNDEVTKMLITINNNEKEKYEQYIEIMHTLLNLIEIKDEYTAGHSKMVTHYATQITKKLNAEYNLNLNEDKIRVASILHDIGKIGISGHILNKPSKLTEEEYEIIKTHSLKGYQALKNVRNLKEEATIIKYHHERFDGKGYPDGIEGNTIPIGSRIICVADAYDAMTSDRPYRKGLNKDYAVEELIKNKGTQFDPFIVDVFISILNEEK